LIHEIVQQQLFSLLGTLASSSTLNTGRENCHQGVDLRPASSSDAAGGKPVC